MNNYRITRTPQTLRNAIIDSQGCALIVKARIEMEDFLDFKERDKKKDKKQKGDCQIGVDLAVSNDPTDTNPGYVLTCTRKGEWLTYKVKLSAGKYQLTSRLNPLKGGQFKIKIADVSRKIDISPYSIGDGWQTFLSHKKITVTEGEYEVKIKIQKKGFELNWIEFNAVELEGYGKVN